MFDSEDQWPLPNYSTASTKHLHALGVISLNYNMYERGLVFLLEFYLKKKTAEFLFDRLTNEQKVAAIKHFAQTEEADPVIGDLIQYSMLHFARCQENRNILMHSKQFFETADLEFFLSLEKKPKGKEPLTFYLGLKTLRKVADQIMEGVFFISDIWQVVEFRRNPPEKPPLQPPSLPDKPRLPDILSPTRLLAAIRIVPNQPEEPQV